MSLQPLSSEISTELPIIGFDAITFYVGNAKQAAFFYNKCLGFDIVAYAGPETGCPETASYLLKQNQITFIVTAALSPHHAISEHVTRHGDGIKDLGMQVLDAQVAYNMAISRGATSIAAPQTFSDTHGQVIQATVGTYGDTTHTFYQGHFLPGYQPYYIAGQSIGLTCVDHAVGNIEKGSMDTWADFYQTVFGFYVLRHYSKEDISTEYSALVSKVMANRSGSIKLPLNEPADGRKKSQIQEYLDYYGTPGIQHLAISTDNIIETVSRLRQNGIAVMTVPQNYYDSVLERVGTIDESLVELAKLGIIVDRDDDGYLLQIFTQPLQDRPTLFFEIIQRHGATGFGIGNFKALFEAIERDQDKRGNL